MLLRVDRILIRVPGLESAVRYYRDVLGMKLIKQDARLATLALADGLTELVLHIDPDLPDQAIYYLVDEVRDLYRRRAELKLQFVTAPQQVTRGHRAVVKDPFGNVLMLIDRTAEGTTATTAPEDTKAPGALFAGVEEQAAPVDREQLSQIYQSIGRTADDLPYTSQFETLYQRYIVGKDPKPTKQDVWRHLLNHRKGGKLPKLGEAKSRPPVIEPELRERLRVMLGSDIGKRDRLPYTERFDTIVDEFNKSLARPLSPHLVWRLVATLAK